MRRLLIFPVHVFFLFFASPAPAGPVACTQIGCDNGLFLTADPAYRWQPGAYRFAFTLDGKNVTCAGALPLPPCETPAISCSAPEIHITESGCALPASAQGFGDIRIETAARQVSVRVERDGKAVAENTFAPTYATVQPNGARCGPVCRQATVALPLSVR